MCDALRPLVIFDERLNSIKYIDILETYLPTAFPKYPPSQLPKIFSTKMIMHVRMCRPRPKAV